MDPAEIEQDDKMEGPEVHTPHAPHTGHRWWDFAIGGSAMVVSLISLYVAVHHGEIMEKLVAANSWPNVEVNVNIDRGADPGSAQLTVTADNNGVGPARIETLELFSENKPIRDARDIIRAIKAAGGGGVITGRLEGATIIGDVLGPKEATNITRFVATDGEQWSAALVKAGTAIDSRVCYCSVFDECYVVDSRAASRRSVRVDACPAASVMYNDNVGETLLAMQPPKK